MAELRGQMSSRQAVVLINKLGAAQRQLDAAIRMTFAKEDELAIHTVAAAAYRILRDMLAERKRHDAEDLYRAGLYSFARSIAHGEMSDAEIEDLKHQHPQLYSWVLIVAEDIKIRGDKVTEDDRPIRMSGREKASDWRKMSDVANFLKHADRDPTAHLPSQKVDNDTLLMRACAAYVMVSRTSTPEMVVFYIFSSLAPQRRAMINGAEANELADVLERLSPSRRRRACSKIIRAFKKTESMA